MKAKNVSNGISLFSLRYERVCVRTLLRLCIEQKFIMINRCQLEMFQFVSTWSFYNFDYYILRDRKRKRARRNKRKISRTSIFVLGMRLRERENVIFHSLPMNIYFAKLHTLPFLISFCDYNTTLCSVSYRQNGHVLSHINAICVCIKHI